MNKIFLSVFCLLLSSMTFAADIEDAELLSDKVVGYFKKVSLETGKPVSLKISLVDTFGEGDSIEDEKELLSGDLPELISKSFVIEISDILKVLIPEFMKGKDLRSLMLKTTMWINAPGHKEKVNGFCSLGSR